MFHRWLVAHDLDTCSDAAATMAAQIAVAQAQVEGKQGRLVLCHVVVPVPLVIAPDVMGLPDMVATLAAANVDAGHELEAKAAALRTAFPALRIETRLVSGPAVPTILDEADRQDVDAIAVGTHGLHGLAHALLGSVAEKTANRSRKPVLVAKLDPPAA